MTPDELTSGTTKAQQAKGFERIDVTFHPESEKQP